MPSTAEGPPRKRAAQEAAPHGMTKPPPYGRGSGASVTDALGALYVHGVEALGALLHLENDLVAFVQGNAGTGLMNEDVLAAIVRGDETETFLRVEELHCTT